MMQQLLDFLVENEPSFRRARLPALYSDFRAQRTLNPDGYQANVSAWRRALALIARSGLAPSRRAATTPNLLVLDCDEQLLRALETKQYGRPLALGAAVNEALAARDLIPLPTFLAAKESIYHHSRPWSSSLSGSVWGLAGWVLRQAGVADFLRSSDSSSVPPSGQFVVLANVEEAARQFGEQTAGKEEDSASLLLTRFERTFSRAHFCRAFGARLAPPPGRQLSEADVDVLLRFLARDKGVLLYDGRTVRIRAPTTAATTTAGEDPAALTDEDHTVAQLKELQAYLAHQTAVLDARVAELARAARDAVNPKGKSPPNRAAALAALRAKKAAEATLAQRHASRAQVDDAAARIEQASDSAALVRAMEASAAALAALNARVGGAERVEAVVDRLRAQVDATDEVATILAEGTAARDAVVVDEDEVDEELEAMEREEREKEEKRKEEEMRRRLEVVGDVPSGLVPATKDKEKEKEKEEEKSADPLAEAMSRISLGENA